jgi:diguanylate cyclase (GGDEF)-like protein
MTSLAWNRIRSHRRILADRWVHLVAETPRLSAFWRDAHRLDRHALAGLDALLAALPTGESEPFRTFAGLLSQEALALQVPVDEVIRALLAFKPVVVEVLAGVPPSGGPSLEETIGGLDRLISAGIVEAIGRYERQHHRRAAVLQGQIEELRGRLRREGPVDPLTGLLTAEAFLAAVRREIARTRRFARTFTVGVIALEEPETIRAALGEDGLGHLIRRLADLLSRRTRQVDIRATLGGGRFGLLLPETPLEGAVRVAERLRREVEQGALADAHLPSLRRQTIGIGLACYPHDGEDHPTLVARAEEALARERARPSASRHARPTPESPIASV